MTTFIWQAETNVDNWSNVNEWATAAGPAGSLPNSGDTVLIAAGTVELAGTTLVRMPIDLIEPTTGVELSAENVSLEADVVISTVVSPGKAGGIVYDAVATGTLGTSATIICSAYPLTLELSADTLAGGTSATFVNDGAIAGAWLTIAAPTAPVATFVNNSSIEISETLTVSDAVTLMGSGDILFESPHEPSANFAGPVGAGQTISFTSVPSTGTLHVIYDTVTLSDLPDFQGTVDLDREAEIVLPGMATTEQSFSDGVLTFANGDTLAVTPAGDASDVTVTNAQFEYDGEGATYVFGSVAPCFRAGTRIATPAGAVPVEALRPGDAVRLARGGTAPVQWVGARALDCTRHPKPREIWPVRIRADAFGPGRPARDLHLSPDHAVFAHGALIPARHLLNGATIVQQAVARVQYHHIELARHDLLLAEGLACESYLDTGNRACFGDGPAHVLHPDFSRRIWAEAACAPLVEHGPALAAARRALLRQATRLGHRRTRDPGLLLLADGRPVHALGGTVPLPEGTRELRILSRIWVPAEMRAGETDPRRLGVALGRLWLDGREVALESTALCQGWHAPEPFGRWTDGAAVLRPHGARTLHFALAQTGLYWRVPVLPTPQRASA